MLWVIEIILASWYEAIDRVVEVAYLFMGYSVTCAQVWGEYARDTCRGYLIFDRIVKVRCPHISYRWKKWW